MNTTPFTKLLSDSRRGRDEFLRRWPSPGLLVESAHGKRPTDFDGSDPYPKRAERSETRASGGQIATLDPPRPYLEHANVVWIQKSPRTSFTQIISLGRGAENDLRFDLDALSTTHATFARSGERWFVQDHNSRNGTFVNCERLDAGALRRLSDGDMLRFGDALRARFFGPSGLLDFLSLVERRAPGLDGGSER
jgi:hypothetical protein